MKSNGRCLCTNAELEQVGGMDAEDLDAHCNGPDRAAQVRLVCHNVIEARKQGGAPRERKALGAGQRWGRRGRDVSALDYILRNVLGQPEPIKLGIHRLPPSLRKVKVYSPKRS